MNELFRALPVLLKEFDESEELREAVVLAAWRKIAGEPLHERSVPMKLREKRLTVAVADETWRQHLEDLSGQMIFKINSVLGSEIVTFIEFRVDEKRLRKPAAKSGKPQLSESEFKELALKEVTPALRHSADGIKDDNLRFQFLLAAGSCLARKKKLIA